MDATQTSDPTGVGPGTPGQASAFRRALDEQALDAGMAMEGPLDLTAPLDFAEIRAALSGSGAQARPRLPQDPPPPPPGGARRGRRRGGEHAAPTGHAGSKRLGRIGVFVALATALSVGTAAALVLSSGGQGASVSLPTTNGNLPVATVLASGPGQVPTSAAPSASPSPSTASPTPSAPASSTAAGSPSPSPSQASSSPSAGPSGSQSAGPTSSSTPFATLQPGSTGASVTEVQQLLAEVDLLYQQQKRHNTVFVDVQDRMLADASGNYGDATENAVAAFQQANGVGAQLGVCDQATFNALVAKASSDTQALGN